MTSLLRSFLAAAVALGGATLLAAASQAASISMQAVSDQGTFGPGDTVTVTIVGTIDPGDTASLVSLALEFDPVFVTPLSVVTTVDPILQSPDQLTSFGGGAPWTVGGNQGTCSANLCWGVNQLIGFSPLAPDQTSVTIVAVFDHVWPGIPVFTTVSDFFGAEDVGAVTVPEPATAGLLALGLAALAAATRRGREPS